MTTRILIIAGSDSGGGAGIQADIKTVTMLGGHAMTAITAITAQNTLGVQAVHPVPTEMVVAQITSCVEDIGVDAIKIGMIGSAETAHAVADWLEDRLNPSPSGEGQGWGLSVSPRPVIMGIAPTPTPPLKERGLRIPIIFDPVMIATSGSILAGPDTIAAFGRLMALASVVTPNIPELAALGGEAAVLAHGCHLVAKGGHGEGHYIVDRLLSPSGPIAELRGKRIDTRDTHGTGCTFASALACGLGQGLAVSDAFVRAVRFVRIALLSAPDLGNGHGPMGHHLGVSPFDEIEGDA